MAQGPWCSAEDLDEILQASMEQHHQHFILEEKYMHVGDERNELGHDRQGDPMLLT